MSPVNRMKNYRDLSARDSLSPGFQFEFYCEGCDFTWRSPFKVHRVGQLTGWLTRFAFMMSDLGKAGRATGAFADAGSREAHDEAFAAAEAQARRYFHQCSECKKQFCDGCWSEDDGKCTSCAHKGSHQQQADYGGQGGGGSQGDTTCCPNCQSPTSGGRFCPECGFDMASTHKSCPSCGSVMPRAARFCTDCGHGF
jgi:hypothetical protein